MSAATADRNGQIRNVLCAFELPLAVDIGYVHCAAVINSAGYVAPATAAAGDRFLGVFSHGVDNSGGSAGDLKAKVVTPMEALWDASGINQTDVGADVWFSDDHTVTLTPGNCYAGVIMERVSASLVRVNHLPALRLPNTQALADSSALTFGDSSDIAIAWDGSKLAVTQATANSGIHLGVDGAGIDLKLFGDSASSYALWDQSADKLILDGADIRLQDNDILNFGDADDLFMAWDGTQFVINALGANSAIHIGVDGAGLDVKFFGDTASSYMLWDQSADKLIINAGSADLGTACEANAYTVGGVAGCDFGPAAPASITVVKGIVTAASS